MINIHLHSEGVTCGIAFGPLLGGKGRGNVIIEMHADVFRRRVRLCGLTRTKVVIYSGREDYAALARRGVEKKTPSFNGSKHWEVGCRGVWQVARKTVRKTGKGKAF